MAAERNGCEALHDEHMSEKRVVGGCSALIWAHASTHDAFISIATHNAVHESIPLSTLMVLVDVLRGVHVLAIRANSQRKTRWLRRASTLARPHIIVVCMAPSLVRVRRHTLPDARMHGSAATAQRTMRSPCARSSKLSRVGSGTVALSRRSLWHRSTAHLDDASGYMVRDDEKRPQSVAEATRTRSAKPLPFRLSRATLCFDA